jgi:uncharacterized protein YukE
MYSDLYQEEQKLRKDLDACIKQLRQNGTAFAEAERTYKIELRKWTLRLKSDGLAVGLIDKTVYGIPEVADLRFARDVADAVYDANKEAINSIKLQLRLVEAQLNREWGTPPSDM